MVLKTKFNKLCVFLLLYSLSNKNHQQVLPRLVAIEGRVDMLRGPLEKEHNRHYPTQLAPRYLP